MRESASHPWLGARQALRPGRTLLLCVFLAPPAALGGNIYQCRDAEGVWTFTDRQCGTGHAGDLVELTAPLNRADPLTDADREHLREIDARPPVQRDGPRIMGIPTAEEIARCERAREQLRALRAAARRPHTRSLLSEGRRARAEVREHCY